jgi:hypothetical protein
MSLDGLRAWIGEVERKLGVRTKVLLVLAAIAIGAAGTAIYLVIDYRDKAVSEGDVQQLKTELETGGAGGTSEVAGLQAEIDALEAQIEELQQEAAKGGGKGKGGGTGTGGSGTGGAGTGAGGSGTETPSVPGLPELPDTQNLPGLP